MIQYQSTVVVAAPSERVWRVLTDVDLWCEWTSSITRIERLDPPSFAAGCRFKIFQPKLRPAIWTVTEVRPETSFTWVSQSPGVKVVAEHVIQPVGDGECRVTLRTTFFGLVGLIIGQLSRSLTQEYMSLEAAGLKRRSEETERSQLVGKQQ